MHNITKVGALYIANNNSLNSIQALSNITNCGTIQIIYNAQLTTLNGLNNLSTIIGDLTITNNIQLRNFCSLQTVLNNVQVNFYSVTNNFYNPTKANIISGNCSI